MARTPGSCYTGFDKVFSFVLQLYQIENQTKGAEMSIQKKGRLFIVLLAAYSERGLTTTGSPVVYSSLAPECAAFLLFDHYIPISKGGLHTTENIRVSCGYCNRSKGSKMPEVYHQMVQA